MHYNTVSLEKNHINDPVRILLWLMCICQILIISGFSSQTAATSSAESTGILERILCFLLNDDINHIDKELFGKLHNFIRKLAHFTIFFMLGFIYIMNFSTYEHGSLIRSALAALICSLCMASIDECHQLFVPGRGAQLRDVCIDFFGSVSGCTLFILLKKVFKCQIQRKK